MFKCDSEQTSASVAVSTGAGHEHRLQSQSRLSHLADGVYDVGISDNAVVVFSEVWIPHRPPGLGGRSASGVWGGALGLGSPVK